MSEESRTFPPSDHKLAQLKREGIFPLSRDVLHAGMFSGLVISGAMIARSYLNSPLRMSELSTGAKPDEMLAFALTNFSKLVVTLVLPALALVLFLGLIQTRFRFRFGRPQNLDGTWRELAGAVKGVGWIVIVILIILFSRETEVPLLALFSTFALALVGFAVALGALSWFVVVLEFRAAHRMSRSEIEAESRELEVRPEARQARSEFYRQ